MAASAVLSELAVVHVVGAVAAAAVGRERGSRVERFAVTARASYRCMSAAEGEIRLRAMIEDSEAPIVRVVAQTAVRPQAPVVRVVFGVAIDALLGSIQERLARVAAVAIDLLVASEKRKGGQIVVEANVL